MERLLSSLRSWRDVRFSVSVEGSRAQLHPTPRALAGAVQGGGISQDQSPHQDGENSRVRAQPPTTTASHQSVHFG